MKRRVRLVAAPLVAGALIAAACGGSSDGGSDSSDSGSEEPADAGGDDAAEADDDADAGDDADGGDDADAGDDAMADGDAMAEDDGTNIDPASITRGGTLTYLLEAESDSWYIPGANCAVSCITVMRSVADTMLIVNADNEVEPHLVESFEVNDDFTEWTFVARDGVNFQDGTPVDGAAIQRNLIEMASGALQGQVFWDLANGSPAAGDEGADPADSIVLVDDKTVKVMFDQPVATFGYALSDRTGYVLAPAFWDDPDRAGAMPIASGPFQMVEQVRGEVTRVEANPNYWRTGADGEALPYLDAIEFRPNPDVDARLATMQAGDADLNMDSFGENRLVWEEDWVADGNGVARKAEDREVTYLLINNSAAPFDNVEFRRAVALCTDRNEYIEFRSQFNPLANGPFAEGSAGYIDDPGFPEFDPDAGNAILDEIGRQPIVYGTTNVPANLVTAELFQEQWSENCGLDVTIDQFEQSELITKAITGDFQVFLWRNHGQGNPGMERIWWDSRHAAGLALNFGRIQNPDMDALLAQTSATLDQDTLDDLGKQINELFAENVHNIWLNTTEWNNPYREGVHNVGNMTLESGNAVQGQLAGRIWIQEVWIDS